MGNLNFVGGLKTWIYNALSFDLPRTGNYTGNVLPIFQTTSNPSEGLYINDKNNENAFPTFVYSIYYIFLIFAALLIDHYLI